MLEKSAAMAAEVIEVSRERNQKRAQALMKRINERTEEYFRKKDESSSEKKDETKK